MRVVVYYVLEFGVYGRDSEGCSEVYSVYDYGDLYAAGTRFMIFTNGRVCGLKIVVCRDCR